MTLEQHNLTEEMMNRAFRSVLVGVEEVVGKNGMAALLRQAGLAQYINNYPPSNTEYGGHQLCFTGQINRALYDIYGARGARAILRRVGHEQAKSALHENPAITGTLHVGLKLMSRTRKTKTILDILLKEYGAQVHGNLKVVEEGNVFYWSDFDCHSCYGWTSQSPVCYTMLGFLHGMLAWGLDSDDFHIEEIECRGMGADVCRFKIDVTPQAA